MYQESISLAASASARENDLDKLVSVIIPTYNAARWVADTIDSVMAQTYGHIELIVVDDGSGDDTVAAAQGKLSNDFEKPWRIARLGGNLGPSAARNAGLRLARGSWVQFLDSDDFLAPAKLEQQMAYCARAPSDVVAICSTWRRGLFTGGKVVWDGPAVQPYAEGLAPMMFLTPRASALHPSGLARRTALERVGAFDETLRFWEFEELNVRLAKAGRIEAVPSPEPSYIWRLHPGKIYIGGHDARYRSADVALGWIKLVLRAAEHQPLKQLGLSAEDQKAVLDNCTMWGRLLYSWDRSAFREYLAMSRHLVPDITPSHPRYVSLLARHVGYENAEAISKLGRWPKAVARKSLQAVKLHPPPLMFDWG
jgi:glycosyltransferase involved in cell wall biosynthesis